MTISTTASSVTVAGNGATASFGFSFIAGTASNIVVTYTDANSNATVLVQGSQYTLSINAAVAGQIWGVGGTVTYPLSGTPIAAGTYLTISRIVPVTQLTSISNQGDFYPQSVEKALDTLEMQIQQAEGQIGRALLFNIADQGPFGTLPIASVRAGMILGFDSSGNPGVFSELPVGSVSSAMVPVVEAASTGAALALLGGLPISEGPTIATVSNVAALESATSTSLSQTVCILLGYTTSGDGGEGVFYVGAAATPNGGTIINDASGRTWYREKNGQPYNIAWFGGGPSVADNTAAWNLMVAALPAGGGAVSFSPGKYVFAGAATYTCPNYTAGIKITGSGMGSTILDFAGGGGLSVVFAAGSGSASFNSATIADMSVVTGTTNTGSGVSISISGNSGGRPSEGAIALTNLDIRGSDGPSLTNYWANGISIAGVSNVTATGCIVSGNNTQVGGGNGFSVSGTSENIPTVINLTSCETYNVQTGFLYGAYTQGVTISQCNFTGGTNGIQSAAGATNLVQLNVSLCQMEMNALGGAAIVMNSVIADLNISLNDIYVPSGGTDGIALNASERTTIVGNRIYYAGTEPGGGSGIYVGANTADGGPITGNSIIGFSNGISLSSGTTGWNVQSNYYRANTTNVSNAGTGNTVGGGSP